MAPLSRENPGGSPQPTPNPFMDLRKMALEATTELAAFDPSRADHQVYGALMDWGMGTGVATLFALQDGTASLYLSTGGGVIGGGSHEPVKSAARAFVRSFEPFVGTMSPDPRADLPSAGFTDLRALTTTGRLVLRATTEEFGRRRHPMADVFFAAQALIGALRAVADQRK